MDLFTDFRLKFIVKYDYTFWMHLIRDAVICCLGCFVGLKFGVGLAVGINLAWEWQDGLLNDGFNWLDLLAGLIGVTLVVVMRIFIGGTY